MQSSTEEDKGNKVSLLLLFFFQDQKKMKRDLEDETKARKSLENLLKKFMKNQQAINTVNKDKEVEENHT